MEKKYLRTSEILSFSTAGFGRSMIYNLMSIFLLIFYTDAMKLQPVHAGAIILAARIFDAANDPVMGIIADKTKTKFGKLRPYLLFSPFLILISTALLFNVPESFSYNGKLAYSAITYILWGICFTIQDVPFWGMSAVVSPIEQERNKFLSTARIFCTIGGIIPSVLVPVLSADNSLGTVQGYRVSGIIFAVLGSMLSLLAFFGTKERIEQTKEKTSVKEIVTAYTKNAPLLLLILASVLGSAMLMIQTSGSYIAKYLIQDSGIIPAGSVQVSMTVAIGIGMMVAMVLMPILRKKLSLKQIYIISALFGAAIHTIIYFVGYANFYVLLALLIVAGLPLGIFNVITYAMVADSVDYLEWKTGRRSEGVCFASQTFISKLTAGISTFITSIVLEIIGFENLNTGISAAETSEILDGMFFMVSAIPAISLALCAIPMIFNKYTGKRKEEIQKELIGRREKSNVN
ncbi:MAG: glycoside-pentoside-hexuronide (GPH):cation symporter [Acutalibacteraceae bacterium]|nr:glycoside-pentoside-hexuronide (GPH):cation symporter [Acutalibacteraceae bacterium]